MLLGMFSRPASSGNRAGRYSAHLHRGEPTRYTLESAADQLEFVTVEGLLAYGEMLAHRTAGEGIAFPPIPLPQSIDHCEP